MARFEIGDRVRLRKAVPAEELLGWPAPAGSLGTVKRVNGAYGGWLSYEVLLDDHPDEFSTVFSKDELEAAS